MTSLKATRTLVKSPPELWSECSDAASLAKHLGAFGEIRITKLEPETAVAWEGAAARGTVKLEPSGWGTRVVLTVEHAAEPTEAPEAPEPTEAPEATEAEKAVEPEAAAVALAAATRPSLFARMLSFLPRRSAVREPEPGPEMPEAEPEPEVPGPEIAGGSAPVTADARNAAPPAPSALDEALDSLGRAHHRPYSRA
jgi:hypothetical protein